MHREQNIKFAFVGTKDSKNYNLDIKANVTMCRTLVASGNFIPECNTGMYNEWEVQAHRTI